MKFINIWTTSKTFTFMLKLQYMLIFVTKIHKEQKVPDKMLTNVEFKLIQN